MRIFRSRRAPRVFAFAFLALAGCSSSTTPPSKATVTLDGTATFKGNLSIAGTVNFPSAPSNRSIQLTVSAAPGGTPTFAGTVGNASASSVDYVIKGVVGGQYLVRMTVDQNGNGTFGDSGDFDGYYNGDGFGTFKPPALAQTGATQIPVPPPGSGDAGPNYTDQAGDTGINFALAAVP